MTALKLGGDGVDPGELPRKVLLHFAQVGLDNATAQYGGKALSRHRWWEVAPGGEGAGA